jgi:hypothetical protein
MNRQMVTYRVYADGTVVHEDEFGEWDNAQPYYDDYGQYDIPIELEQYIADWGKAIASSGN